MKKLFIFAIFLLVSSAMMGDSFMAKSPSGKYGCTFNRVINPDGEYDPDLWIIRIALTAEPNKLLFVMKGIRSASVKWSPLDDWFSILEEEDGHFTYLHIFEIIEEGKGFSVKHVYQPPYFDSATVHWDIISWNMSKGTVDMKVEYEDEGEDGIEIKTCRYKNVPFCPFLMSRYGVKHGE